MFAKQLEPEDAKGAAAAFQQLVASAKDLNNKDKDRAQAYHATVFASENPSDSPDILVPFGFWSDVGDVFNGMWHWLGEVADTVWHWTCDLVGKFNSVRFLPFSQFDPPLSETVTMGLSLSQMVCGSSSSMSARRSTRSP